MPTISDLKDQARALEQQGEIEKALTIYQHILKHLEGNPAITKVLPLYVKAGDLLHKLDRNEEAVASFQAAAEHYAATGAATRVTALCEKILRLTPERTDVYTSFVRLLIKHGHVGSARDVLAEYARVAQMDRALETLDDLAGRPNNEVQPMLERLLDSFELEEQDDEAAVRVSTQLEQVTDDLAGELTGVPETPEPSDTAVEDAPEEREVADEYAEMPESEETEGDQGEESEPLTPHMLDLDRMPRQSSIQRAISDEDLDEMEDEEEQESEGGEQDPEEDVTTDLTPTMERPLIESELGDEHEEEVEHEKDDEHEDEHAHTDRDKEAAEEGELNLLLAESMTAADVDDTEDTREGGSEFAIEGSEWKPDLPEPSAEETVAAEWSPEEELQPAARYPSDEYDTPSELVEEATAEEAPVEEPPEADDVQDEIARAVEESEAFEPADGEPVAAQEPEDAVEPYVEEAATPAEREPEPSRRPSRPPRVMLPDDTASKSKSPVVFGIVGFVLGLVVGAVLAFVFLGGGGGSSPTPVTDEGAAAVEPTTSVVEEPASTESEDSEPPETAPEPEQAQTTTLNTLEGAPVDTAGLSQAETAADTPGDTALTETDVATPDSIVPDTAIAEQPAADAPEPPGLEGNPIIVAGMDIAEFSEVESEGRIGFRVVHALDWADPLVIEAYRDTSVTMSTFIQVNVTEPDTVVGIRRMDGYMVYASSVMPEDSLRSLMSRLVEGELPPNQ